MKYQEQTRTTGNWAKNSEIKSGTLAKIKSETMPVSSTFKDKEGNIKNQDVCKVRFEDKQEAVNVSLNKATIGGLIKAFGEDSNDWIDKTLVAETEKMRVAGKAVVALYLIPAGFKRIDDENGYALIVKEGGAEVKEPEKVEATGTDYPEEEANPNDIPF